MQTLTLKPPYLIFVGDTDNEIFAKTGFGLVEWRSDLCLGQIALSNNCVDLGLPLMSLEEAVGAGVRSVVIGNAFVGGSMPDKAIDVLEKACSLGLDIVGGVHTQLNSITRLKNAAQRSGSNLIDVRVPPENIPVGTGKKRSGKRLLTVGTDCALGKKYTALALERDMRTLGWNVDFRASGQTGIMIAGSGIPIDAVVSDFVSGAAEILSPNNDSQHWDIIEGQGGLFHPGYGAVSYGLLIGSQPDAFIVCHEVGRTHITGWPEFEVPSIKEVIERTINIGSLTNPAIRCVGVSVNTSKLSESKKESYLNQLSIQLGLPCIDPLRCGTTAIIENIAIDFPESKPFWLNVSR